jgi:signal peptidase I
MQKREFLRPGEIQIIRKSLGDVAAIAAVGIPLLVLLRSVVPISHIPSESMEPTLHGGDHVMVNNMQYLTKAPERGDIVAFDSGFRTGLLNKEQVLFVKRVVGMPGDELQIVNGSLYINGDILTEPYAVGEQGDFALTKVTPGHYFLMGDNRDKSYDSRYLGSIPEDRIKGKVLLTLPVD